MTRKIKVLDIEIGHPLQDLTGLDGYHTLRALVRLHGSPVGYINLPIDNGRCCAASLRAAIRHQHANALLKVEVRHRLQASPAAPEQPQSGAADQSTVQLEANRSPRVTVAVCTRNRTNQLVDCLDSIRELDYENLEVLVIDNAPSTDDTRKVVQSSFPEFRYVCEPRPGLDWARNRAITEASGEIIAYTDDDCMVDPAWARVLARVFFDDPAVMAITGLVAPYELETEAQLLFERNGGFGRGFRRHWFRLDPSTSGDWPMNIGAGRFGTGANMAYRRIVFLAIGGFDPALDVGTPTNGGGDLEMFFRVLQEGYTLVYEPDAIVWHKHRRSLKDLQAQITNNGIGLYSYFMRSAIAYPDLRWTILRFGWWWIWFWSLRRLLKSVFVRPLIPRALMVAELKGSLLGLIRYGKSKRNQQEIERRFAAVGLPVVDAGIEPTATRRTNEENR